MSDKIDALVAEFEKVHKEFKEKAQSLLKESFKDFWDNNPKIEMVTWTQYTPYFNDGEPCEFSRGDIWALTKYGVEGWEEAGGGYAEEYDCRYGEEKDPLSADEKKRVNDFDAVLNKIPDQIYLEMFDDHQIVKATREGFEVEEYSHD